MKNTLASFGVALSAAACGIFDFEDPFRPLDEPRCEGEPVIATGDWRISGEGVRRECDDPQLNAGGLRIASAAIPVRQTGDTLETDALEGFAFTNGRISRSCVVFTTIEGTGERRVTIDWTGDVLSPTRIEGTFTGRGPESCRTTGTFTVQIDP